MDRGAWWATVHGVAKSQTRLSNFTFTAILPSFHTKCYRASQSTSKRKDQSGLGCTEGCFHSDGLTVLHTTQSPRALQTPYQRTAPSTPVKPVYMMSHIESGHTVPFLASCKILAPPLYYLPYSSKEAQDCSTGSMRQSRIKPSL